MLHEASILTNRHYRSLGQHEWTYTIGPEIFPVSTVCIVRNWHISNWLLAVCSIPGADLTEIPIHLHVDEQHTNQTQSSGKLKFSNECLTRYNRCGFWQWCCPNCDGPNMRTKRNERFHTNQSNVVERRTLSCIITFVRNHAFNFVAISASSQVMRSG